MPARHHTPRPTSPRHGSPAADQPDATARSAAWLAAKAAFAAMPAGPQPLVIVRRTRKLALPTEPALVDAANAADAQTDDRASRVFRVGAAVPAEQQPAAAVADAAEATAARGRRMATDKRPGPVHQVFVAPPAAPAEVGQSPQLANALARLDPLFSTIRSAHAFRTEDGSFADEWQRLSQAAQKIHRHIEALQSGDSLALLP